MKYVLWTLLFTVMMASTVQATTINCKTVSSSRTSDLAYSTSPLRLDVRNVFGGKEFKSIYLAEQIACGEAIQSIADCSVSETWDVPQKGSYGASFSCKSGQVGDVYFENGAVQVQCTQTTGKIMQVTLDNCTLKP